ncbi:CBS domain-containing protein [Cellulomonas sp. 73-145]|uniref:magnesium transporter MgtE N-terminal domain-containing protein n=1 Tax=Cellulomonas sp. 73-145 TaxID=1895739 RepID=UPI000AE383EB|nr:CBS domain-containing protein [Cellulomonas sp. 73-145]
MNTTVEENAESPIVYLSSLLKHPVVDIKGKPLGKLADAIVRLRAGEYPQVSALAVQVSSGVVFVPIADVSAMSGEQIQLATARLDVRPFERRAGEVLLRADVLGHRLIDVEHAALVRANDILLTRVQDQWVVTGLDVRGRTWWGGAKKNGSHHSRDWRSFEALIGHEPSVLVRSTFGQLQRLKAAQIADLIETASVKEQDELLTQVHEDPELEADVFEELEEDRLAQLLRTRSLTEVASVLNRMRADDAADAVTDLPQDRRQAVLDLMNTPQRIKVMSLLGYQNATAGGLMGVEYLAVSEDETIEHAVNLVRVATGQQPEALTMIFSIDDDKRLVGAISLVHALQVAPGSLLSDVAESDPVHAAPQDDIVDVTTRMADFNLLVLPVLDDRGRILGVVTVDDALEGAIPDDWRRREPQSHVSST